MNSLMLCIEPISWFARGTRRAAVMASRPQPPPRQISAAARPRGCCSKPALLSTARPAPWPGSSLAWSDQKGAEQGAGGGGGSSSKRGRGSSTGEVAAWQGQQQAGHPTPPCLPVKVLHVVHAVTTPQAVGGDVLLRRERGGWQRWAGGRQRRQRRQRRSSPQHPPAATRTQTGTPARRMAASAYASNTWRRPSV